MNNQLVWFRTDLRVRDNSALLNALVSGPTIAIYIATPAQWALHNDAEIKLDFWRRNLDELKLKLGELNVELISFQVADYKAIPVLFDRILNDLGIVRLHYNRECPLNEKRRDKLVDTLCSERSVSVSSYDSEMLVPPASFVNQAGTPFKVFTPFAKKLRKKIADEALFLAAPQTPPANSSRPIVKTIFSRCELGDIEWPKTKKSWLELWPAGEDVSQRKLVSFAAGKISAYKDKRDLPAQDGTSTLSPYLASGALSVGDCWRMAQHHDQNDGVLCWQNELLWRDFYKHIAFHFPQVCMHKPFKAGTDNVPWKSNESDFEKWCQGKTGYPLVDAGMRQLLSNGWMHNRVRMVTAMFLSKHLLIDWRWGERWFMQNLVDGDFASNNGGWQWSASTGVDAVPYFRIFSPKRQSQRFDADGDYIRRYVPELEGITNRHIHEPGRQRPGIYPAPMVDHQFARERALQAFADI